MSLHILFYYSYEPELAVKALPFEKWRQIFVKHDICMARTKSLAVVSVLGSETRCAVKANAKTVYCLPRLGSDRSDRSRPISCTSSRIDTVGRTHAMRRISTCAGTLFSSAYFFFALFGVTRFTVCFWRTFV